MKIMFLTPNEGNTKWGLRLTTELASIPRIGESVTLEGKDGLADYFRVVDVWHSPGASSTEVYLRGGIDRGTPPIIEGIEPYTVILADGQEIHRVSGTFVLPVGATVELPGNRTVTVREVKLCEYSDVGAPSHVALVVG